MITIPHNTPLVTEQDINTVSNILRSGWVAHGLQVSKLEDDFVNFLNGGGACACSSGTAALFLGLVGLGMKHGYKVALPTYACSALLNAVYMAGAQPVVMDVCQDDFTLDPKKDFRGVDVAVVVHIYGARGAVELVKNRVPIVIEDCCQSLGGLENGDPIGIVGSAAIFSFYATKVITCGHGGLVWYPDERVADITRDYRDFDGCKTYKPRFNFHLSDIQAGMAREQFSRIERIRDRRIEIARKYMEALPPGVDFQAGSWNEERMAYRFVLLMENKKQRDSLKTFLNEAGIGAIIPIERFELLHRYLGLDPIAFPVAEKLADTTLSIPLYPSLSDKEVNYISEKLSMAEKL